MKYNTLYTAKRRSHPCKIVQSPCGDRGITFIRKNKTQGYFASECDIDADFFVRNQQAATYDSRDINDIGKLLCQS